MKLHLPDVTLLVVDTVCHELAALAVKDALERTRFRGVVIHTDDVAPFRRILGSADARSDDDLIYFRKIERFASVDAAMAHLWYDAPALIQTSHALIVQWDAGIVDALISRFAEMPMAGAVVPVHAGEWGNPVLIARKLFETRVLTCASPAYLERRGVPRTPHDLTHHECLLFRDPQTGRPFPWEFHRGKQIIEIAVTGRVMMDDPSAAVAACIAGQGVFQSLEIGLRAWFASGELVHVLPDWSNERWPLYAYHPSRHLPPAKVRAFLDFVQEIAR